MKRKTRLYELYLELPMNFASRTEAQCGKCNDAIFYFTFIHFTSDESLSLTLYLKVDWLPIEQFQFRSRQAKEGIFVFAVTSRLTSETIEFVNA
jgi:hypothetical protein